MIALTARTILIILTFNKDMYRFNQYLCRNLINDTEQIHNMSIFPEYHSNTNNELSIFIACTVLIRGLVFFLFAKY